MSASPVIVISVTSLSVALKVLAVTVSFTKIPVVFVSNLFIPA